MRIALARSLAWRVVAGGAAALLLIAGGAAFGQTAAAPPLAIKPVPRTPIADGFTLATVGDMIYLRPMSATIAAASPAMVALLQGADITFGNLETSVIDLDDFAGAPQAESGGSWLFASPGVAADVRGMGFDLVSTANNHTTDWGVEGMFRHRRPIGWGRARPCRIGPQPLGGKGATLYRYPARPGGAGRRCQHVHADVARGRFPRRGSSPARRECDTDRPHLLPAGRPDRGAGGRRVDARRPQRPPRATVSICLGRSTVRLATATPARPMR